MGVGDVGIIGVGKDIHNSYLDQMVDGRILPWVEDVQANDYPVWTDYMAVQRSTYIFNRDGELIHSFDITTYDPNEPDNYTNMVNLILDYLGIKNDTEILPGDFVLYQNYPNPFNPSTTIEFDVYIGIERTMSLQIIDITGRMVETLVSQDLEPGNYKFKFDGSVHPSGLYFIKLSTKGHVEIKKAILVK